MWHMEQSYSVCGSYNEDAQEVIVGRCGRPLCNCFRDNEEQTISACYQLDFVTSYYQSALLHIL